MDEDDYESVSKIYMMDLIQRVEVALWNHFPEPKYTNVRRYIERWHECDDFSWENFTIYFKESAEDKIDLGETLSHMSNDLVIKIAIELGVDTPGFIPAIPIFKNILKESNNHAFDSFNNATKNVCEHPDQAVALASSTLESIIKTILSDEGLGLSEKTTGNESLSKLVKIIVRELGLAADANAPRELRTLATQLRGIGETIDNLRSDKSNAHGKAPEDYIIDDPLWAEFVVNAAASLGLFLYEFYNRKYLPLQDNIDAESLVGIVDDGEIPF